MPTNHGARILIIDNDEDLVRAISTRLEHLGYACTTAVTGAQGLSILREGEVDLVITDLNMPNGDGFEVLKSIRATGKVPAIVVTGFTEEYRDQLRRLRGVARLPKPFESQALVDLVELELASARAGAEQQS